MEIVQRLKTRLRRKMEDEFFANSLITYIEKDIAKLFDDDSIIDILIWRKSEGRILEYLVLIDHR